jgi:hypothetical protein
MGHVSPFANPYRTGDRTGLVNFIPERDPETIQIANDQFAHAVVHVARRLEDFPRHIIPLVLSGDR